MVRQMDRSVEAPSAVFQKSASMPTFTARRRYTLLSLKVARIGSPEYFVRRHFTIFAFLTASVLLILMTIGPLSGEGVRSVHAQRTNRDDKLRPAYFIFEDEEKQGSTFPVNNPSKVNVPCARHCSRGYCQVKFRKM